MSLLLISSYSQFCFDYSTAMYNVHINLCHGQLSICFFVHHNETHLAMGYRYFLRYKYFLGYKYILPLFSFSKLGPLRGILKNNTWGY